MRRHQDFNHDTVCDCMILHVIGIVKVSTMMFYGDIIQRGFNNYATCGIVMLTEVSVMTPCVALPVFQYTSIVTVYT